MVEPRDSALFPQAAEDFRAKLADPSYHGAVFFAVCRWGQGGKICILRKKTYFGGAKLAGPSPHGAMFLAVCR